VGLKDIKHTPRRSTLRLLLDDTIRIELEEARLELTAYERNAEATLDSKPYQRFEAAKAAADEAAVSFVFEAVSRSRLAELVAAHPPTTEELDHWKDQDRNNPLTVIEPPAFSADMAPYLIAASMVEPETTEAEVLEMWNDGGWSDAVWSKLWSTAWDKTNRGVTTLPTYGTDSAKTPVSGPKQSTS
jgi:hypothetical protein